MLKQTKLRLMKEKEGKKGKEIDPEANNKIIKHGRVKIIFNISSRLKLLEPHDNLSVFY